jgi:hypothetical protein
VITDFGTPRLEMLDRMPVSAAGLPVTLYEDAVTSKGRVAVRNSNPTARWTAVPATRPDRCWMTWVGSWASR